MDKKECVQTPISRPPADHVPCMQIFVRKKKYKAREPEETVAVIKKILSDRGISTAEEKRYEAAPDVASSRVWLNDGILEMGDFGTNGKGMTEAYSLASAYAELMERLQNSILFGDYSEDAYQKGLTKYMAAPDEVMLSAAEAFDHGREVLTELLRLRSDDADFSKISGEDKMPCLPYHDVFNDSQVLLPHKTLRMVTGSNGMCAGNTYKEAVTQGLSELYERAAVMECYRDEPVIKKIDPECFAQNAVYSRLEKLKSIGYKYSILDLSMGKNYPVIGLLLEHNGSRAFKAGADPCPVTALERCLTEMFQGTHTETLRLFKSECCPPFTSADERTRYMINNEEIAYHVDGNGRIAHCLFNPSNEFAEFFAGTDAESEDADYDYLVGLTKQLGYGLYIRDCSYLGFPAYHVVIPQLSNYDLLYEDGADIYEWSFEKIAFRQDRMTAECAKVLNAIFPG